MTTEANEMKEFREPSLADRREMAAKARQAILEKARAKSAAMDAEDSRRASRRFLRPGKIDLEVLAVGIGIFDALLEHDLAR